MDEIIFRSNQKLEIIQLQAEIAASKSKDVFVLYIQKAKVLLLHLWNHAAVEEVRTKLSDAVFEAVTAAKDVKSRIIYYANPKRIYITFLNVIGKKWTKRDVFFATSGLLLGTIIGLAIGLSLRKREPVLRYMQAIQSINNLGTQSIMVIEDAIAPHECGENDVLVNVKATSVQMIDVEISKGYGKTLRNILQRLHKQSVSDYPITLGRDCTGVITDIGSKVQRLEVGDEVWLTVPFWSQGTMCQTVLVSENRVGRKPKNSLFESSCSLPYAGSIALSVLIEAQIDASNACKKKILIEGGCTPVACVLIQLLTHWKAKVTATCYKRAVPVVKALGAVDVIVLEENMRLTPLENSEPIEEYPANDKIERNYTKFESPDNECTVTPPYKFLVKQLEFKGDIFDVIIKTVPGAEGLEKFLREDGVMVSTLPPKLTSDNFGYLGRNALALFIWFKFKIQKILGLSLNDYDETHLCYVNLDKLSEFVEDGYLQTVVDKVFQPQDIELAINHIQSTQSIGSTVITFR